MRQAERDRRLPPCKYPLALALLMGADAASTVALVDLGMASEANPLMAWVLGLSTIGFVVGKALLGFLSGCVLIHNPRAARIMALVMTLLACWYICCWVAG